MMRPGLVLDRVSVDRGARPVLTEVSFTLAPGSIVAVVGPNGAGKSSLLEAILGLLPVSGGRVTFDGRMLRDLGARAAALSYMPDEAEPPSRSASRRAVGGTTPGSRQSTPISDVAPAPRAAATFVAEFGVTHVVFNLNMVIDASGLPLLEALQHCDLFREEAIRRERHLRLGSVRDPAAPSIPRAGTPRVERDAVDAFRHTMRACTLLLGILLAGPAFAVTPAGRCKAAKLEAAGRLGVAKLRCHEQAARKGTPNPSCLGDGGERLATKFKGSQKRAKGRCEVEGDAVSANAATDVLATTAASVLRPTTAASRCSADKLKAVRRRVRSSTKAHAGNAARPNGDALAAKLRKSADAFTADFAKAEAKGECQTTGDAAAVARIVDEFLATLLAPYVQTLKEAAPGRAVGAAVRSQYVFNEPPYGATLVREFNQLTPEFEMIWGYLQPSPGVWNFAAPDALVGFAERAGLHVQGTPLVWHEFMPAFVETLDAASLRAALEAHVRTVVARYRGRIGSYVVVNEALAGAAMRQTIFLGRLGPGYIADAFRWAHEEDPDAVLLLNDFAIEGTTVISDFMYDLVQGLLHEGVPIHGVGMQGHFTIYPPPPVESIRQNIQRFCGLGLQVQITELDVADDDLASQRPIYRDVASACAAEPCCTGVTTWGLTDKYHWLEMAALTFDAEYAPKLAYFGMRDGLAGR